MEESFERYVLVAASQVRKASKRPHRTFPGITGTQWAVVIPEHLMRAGGWLKRPMVTVENATLGSN